MMVKVHVHPRGCSQSVVQVHSSAADNTKAIGHTKLDKSVEYNFRYFPLCQS